MTRTSALGVALLLQLLPAAPALAALRIHGWVIAPAASGAVRVEIGMADGPETAVRPRPDGSFEAVLAQPGVYRVAVRGEGLLALEIPALPLVEEVELPPAVLAPARRLEIQVTDQDGRPASGVTVCARAAAALAGAADPGPWVPAERCGTSAAGGRLALPRGAEERLVLGAVDPRFAFRQVEIGDDSSITLGLQRARTVSVEVHGPEGRPAAGVHVRLGLWSAGRTDPAGRVSVGVPEAGADVEIVEIVELAGPGGLRARTVFLPGESDPRSVTLRPPPAIRGRILDAATRRPLSGALVWSGGATARTAADGTFQMDGAAGPEPVVEAAAAGYARRRMSLPPGAGIVTLALPPGSLRWEAESTASRRSEETETAGVLAGRVRGPDGQPVAGALVEAARGAAETDSGGRFRIAGIAPGATVSVTVRAPGLRGGLSAVRTPLDGKPALVEIRLQKAAALEGRVTDAAGRPLAGVWVALQDAPSGRAATDDDGHYLLDGLAPGRSQAVALRPGGRLLARAAANLEEGRNRLDLAAPPGFAVGGRVTDGQGAPVPAARIFLEGVDPEDRWLAVAGEDGAFLVRDVPEGDYRLSALAAGFAEVPPLPVRVAAGPVPDVEVRLGRGGSIAGRLIGLSPGELNGLVILAREERSQRLGLAGADGRYRIPDVPPGHWAVTVRTAAGRQALGSVDVAAGSEAVLDLRMASGLRLAGKLWVDGKPAGGTILATPAGLSGDNGADGGQGAQSPAGADGAFALSGLAPGSYLLLVVLDGALWPVRTVEAAADREIPLEIATGQVTGRILGPWGAPAAGAQVSLVARSHGVDAFLPGARAVADEQGVFTLPRVPAGHHRLVVREEGAGPFETSVSVPAGGTVRIEIPLDRAAT